MPVCFICKSVLKNLSTLILHFKLIHNLEDNSVYRCREYKCFRDFPNLKGFKKHMRTKHCAIHKINKITSHCLENTLLTTANPDSSCSTTQITTNELPSLELFKSALKQKALTFLATLYSNSLLPRNVIQNVVDGVTDFLAGGFISLLKDIILNSFQSTSSYRISWTNFFNVGRSNEPIWKFKFRVFEV